MQVLCILTGTLLLTADLFALIGLAIPKWIVCDIGGQTSIGLLTICTTIYGRSEMCYTPNTFRVEWLVAFICVTIGVLCISIGFVLLVASHWKPAVYSHAKWFGFASVVTFCLAAVIFPLGFDMDYIGGQPYRIPSGFHVGVSYRFFFSALLITVVAELFLFLSLPKILIFIILLILLGLMLTIFISSYECHELVNRMSKVVRLS